MSQGVGGAAVLSEGSTGEGSTPHSCTWLFLAGHWIEGLSSSLMLAGGRLGHFLAMSAPPAWQLASSKPARDSASKSKGTIFCKLVMEVIPHHRCHMFFVRSLSLSSAHTPGEGIT